MPVAAPEHPRGWARWAGGGAPHRPAPPYLRRRWSGLLQGPPENRRWVKGAEGGRLFTASSHGRIGDGGRRMGARDLRLRAGRDSSTSDPAGRTAGHRPRNPRGWDPARIPGFLLCGHGARGDTAWGLAVPPHPDTRHGPNGAPGLLLPVLCVAPLPRGRGGHRCPRGSPGALLLAPPHRDPPARCRGPG